MGLRPGTPVGAGLIDAHAGAAGTLGARAGGAQADPRRRLALILGTSSSCMALADGPRFVDGIWGPHFGALTPDQWLIDGGQSAFGGAIDHLLRLHPAFAELSARAGPHALHALEKEIVARAGGLSQAALIAEDLHVLPDFIGSRSPSADAGARGGVMGMDLREDAASLQELYVAGLCGLAYGLADIVRKLEAVGLRIRLDCRQRRRRAQRIGPPDHRRRMRQDGGIAGDPGAGASGLGDGGRGRGRHADDGLRDVVDVDARDRRGAPAGGAIAAFHARKRRACEMLRRTEREIRELNRKSRWPELVIFDCDGVLVDSELIALGVMRRRLGEAGLRLTDQETRERFLGRRLDSSLHRIETELGAPLPEAFSRRFFARDSVRVRARTEGRRRRAAGCRRFARARMRRLFERA